MTHIAIFLSRFRLCFCCYKKIENDMTISLLFFPNCKLSEFSKNIIQALCQFFFLENTNFCQHKLIFPSIYRYNVLFTIKDKNKFVFAIDVKQIFDPFWSLENCCLPIRRFWIVHPPLHSD